MNKKDYPKYMLIRNAYLDINNVFINDNTCGYSYVSFIDGIKKTVNLHIGPHNEYFIMAKEKQYPFMCRPFDVYAAEMTARDFLEDNKHFKDKKYMTLFEDVFKDACYGNAIGTRMSFYLDYHMDPENGMYVHEETYYLHDFNKWSI